MGGAGWGGYQLEDVARAARSRPKWASRQPPGLELQPGHLGSGVPGPRPLLFEPYSRSRSTTAGITAYTRSSAPHYCSPRLALTEIYWLLFEDPKARGGSKLYTPARRLITPHGLRLRLSGPSTLPCHITAAHSGYNGLFYAKAPNLAMDP